MNASDATSQPPAPRVDTNQTFWKVTIHLTVLQACAGNALLLAAWVAAAAAIDEDRALRGTPRSVDDLIAAVAHQLGLANHPHIAAGLLVELERLSLLMVIDGAVIVPTAALAAASAREGQRLQAEAKAHQRISSHRQDALPGFAD